MIKRPLVLLCYCLLYYIWCAYQSETNPERILLHCYLAIGQYLEEIVWQTISYFKPHQDCAITRVEKKLQQYQIGK